MEVRLPSGTLEHPHLPRERELQERKRTALLWEYWAWLADRAQLTPEERQERDRLLQGILSRIRVGRWVQKGGSRLPEPVASLTVPAAQALFRLGHAALRGELGSSLRITAKSRELLLEAGKIGDLERRLPLLARAFALTPLDREAYKALRNTLGALGPEVG